MTLPASELADRYVDEWDRVSKQPGVMWSFEGSLDDPVLTEVDDLREYVLDLAVVIADRTDDASSELRWRALRSALITDGSDQRTRAASRRRSYGMGG